MSLYKSLNINQVSYGESIGIILLKTVTPAIPGDVASALSYSYPIRYKVIEDATIDLMFTNPEKILDKFITAGLELEQEGVKAITGDCGFMAALQKEMSNSIDIPVFMSSLLQVPLINRMLNNKQKIGIITANSNVLNEKYYEGVGINEDIRKNIVVGGMQNKFNFNEFFLKEKPEVDPKLIENEIIELSVNMQKEDNIGAFLIECSVLPPYSSAIQEATNLPVFDFITLINYVQSAVVQTNNVFFKTKY